MIRLTLALFAFLKSRLAYKRHGNLKGAGTNKRYEGIRKSGRSKTSAAKIANAGKTHAARSRMARKAARTRKRRGR